MYPRRTWNSRLYVTSKFDWRSIYCIFEEKKYQDLRVCSRVTSRKKIREKNTADMLARFREYFIYILRANNRIRNSTKFLILKLICRQLFFFFSFFFFSKTTDRHESRNGCSTYLIATHFDNPSNAV